MAKAGVVSASDGFGVAVARAARHIRPNGVAGRRPVSTESGERGRDDCIMVRGSGVRAYIYGLPLLRPQPIGGSGAPAGCEGTWLCRVFTLCVPRFWDSVFAHLAQQKFTQFPLAR